RLGLYAQQSRLQASGRRWKASSRARQHGRLYVEPVARSFHCAGLAPQRHGALPDIVANGRKPGVFACGFCHRATGPGGPENADLAGLPKSYISQQMADYKSGARGTALPARTPPKLMIELSKPMTDAEIEAAASYFSALRPRKRIKVVESDTAPKT